MINIMFNFKLNFFLFAVVLTLSILPLFVFADEVPQELYISSRGQIYIYGAEVSLKHALNFFEINIWKQKFSIVTDYTTKFESAFGEPIDPAEILTGHILEIKGRPAPDKAGLVEAALIHDVSIKKGTPSTSQQPTSILDFMCPVVLVAPAAPLAGVVTPSTATVPILSPPPYDASSGSSVLLTRNLILGDKGKNVAILQKFLQKHGWGIPNDGPVTGFFGKITKDAVMNFQKANALAAVGALDSKTRELINSLLNK